MIEDKVIIAKKKYNTIVEFSLQTFTINIGNFLLIFLIHLLNIICLGKRKKTKNSKDITSEIRLWHPMNLIVDFE